MLNRRSPGSGPGGFNIFKTTGAHRDAPGCETTPGYHRSFSGINRISTVRPLVDTVANQHELCPRWSNGDPWLSHGVSRRRAGVAPTLAIRTTVCYGGSRRMSVKLRWSYGLSTEQAGWPIEIQKQYLINPCLFYSYIIQCKIVTPGRGQCWPHGHNLNNFGRGPLDDVIHQIWKLWSCTFRQEYFWKLHYENLFFWPCDLLMRSIRTIWTSLVEDHLGTIPVEFGQIPISGSR